MSFSDETQEYLLVRPPQTNKPGKHSAHNLQIQRLLPSSPSTSSSPLPRSKSSSPTKSRAPPLRRPRILPILNLESHAIRKSRIVDTESMTTLCKFDREPRGVVGKWQVDLRRGDGGGWIFVGKYERYEWARSRTQQGEDVWKLVRSTYSHSKSLSAGSGGRTRRSTTLSESKTIRASMDDTSPERRLVAKITILANVPPSIIITPRNPNVRAVGVVAGTTTAETEVESMESVNREEVINALIQGLWIVWREGVVEDVNDGRRQSWAPTGAAGVTKRSRKRGIMDVLLCRN